VPSSDLLQLNLDPGSGLGRRTLKWVAGLSTSGLILLLLAHVQKADYVEPPPPPPNLQSLVLEPPPPPPPEIAMREPPPPTVLDLEPLPSDNEVKIAVAPLTYEIPLPEAEPILEISLDAFRPDSMDAERDPNHIFQYRDVDQRPVVTSRVKPQVSFAKIDGRKDLRVVVSMVVTRAGAARHITIAESCGHSFVDEAVMEALALWQFRPAIRNGQPVNCHVIQAVRIKAPRSGSPFSI
jgi:periplasmic protein TonB